MGANTPEVWQNLGLCCFYAAQYDMALKCLERALSLAPDDIAADIWCVPAEFRSMDRKKLCRQRGEVLATLTRFSVPQRNISCCSRRWRRRLSLESEKVGAHRP